MDVPDSGPHERRADLVFAVVTAGLIVVFALLYVAFPTIVVTFTLASVLAYALLPVIDPLAARMPRWVAVIAVVLGAAGVLALVVILVGPSLVEEMRALPAEVERTGRELQRAWASLHGRLPARVAAVVDAGVRSVSQATRGVAPSGATLSAWASQAAATITALTTGLVFIPVFAVLMLRGYHPFVRGAIELVPPRWRPRFLERAGEVDRVLSGFVRGQLAVAAILVVLYGTLFTVVGIPLAILVGIVAGLGEMVPFVGGLIALCAGSLLAVAGGEPWDVLWVLAVYAGVQLLQGTLISPLIVGSKVKLSPITIIVALAIGGQMFGVFGMLASVPVAGVLKVALRAAREAYRDSNFYRRPQPV